VRFLKGASLVPKPLFCFQAFMSRSLLRLSALWAVCHAVLASGADMVVIQFKREGLLSSPVVVELAESGAPAHCANFKKLASKGFYQKTRIHRLLPGVLVQMGDPLSRKKDTGDLGTGGPGYTLAPEIRLKHTRGAVAMGRMADTVNPRKLSNGSQFYICLDSLSDLDGKYTVFGKVVRGLDVLEAYAALPTDTNDVPVVPISIHKTAVVPSENLEKIISKMPTGKPLPWWKRISFPPRLRWPF
jgi:cyclophilin family peptidyl-prolyl cis-trans isomerase